MSTPSLRPLSFNAAPLCLYRQLLSITRWLGKMASATPEEMLLCSRLSAGCGLEGYSNSRKSLIVELKGLVGVLLARISPRLPHTGGLAGVSMKRSQHPCTSCPSCASTPDCPSLTWVALSIPITTHVSMISKQP